MQTGAQSPSIAEALRVGREHHQAGRLAEAERVCRSILEVDPDQPDALNLLGVIANQTGQGGRSVELIETALRHQPSNPNFLSNLGAAYHGLGRLEEALTTFDRALAIKPDHVPALINRGNTLRQLQRNDEAVASYQAALALKPDHAGAHYLLATTLKNGGRLDDAIASYRNALALRPDHAEAHNDLGTVLKDQDKLEAAIASYRNALSLKPELAEVHYNLGVALKAQGRREEAIASYEKALALRPGFVEARWSSAVSRLPVVYGPGDSPSECRAEFAAALAELDAWFGAERLSEGFRAVGTQQPFHLAYQEDNNRDLLARYGALCSRLMDDWLRRQNLRLAPAPSSRMIRLGIVSSHFYNHSVWHAILEGWLRQLDRQRFQLHLFHLGMIHDDQTKSARRNVASFSHGKGGLKEWVEAILGKQLDVLIYPEIGMDSMTTRLASMRLAPIQMCTWGHPQTTGLPSIDYFLSAEDFEPDDADAHYTERLIRLSNLGCSYPRQPVDPIVPDLGALAIDGTLPLLVCPGAPFKYAPQQDRVFVEIARRLGRCRFIFFRGHLKEQTDILQRRLESAFAQSGLRHEDYVTWIPWQPRGVFYGLMQRADVYLDTIGFSGFNTAMQAVESGLPIATREGKFMRGRLASGILKRMNLPELVAPTDEAYIELAVRLATDVPFRQAMKERIRRSRELLFDDPAPVKALEDMLITVAARK